MKGLRTVAALSILTISSFAVAEGGSDRVYGRMIQANEQAMQEYAEANGMNPPEVIHYRYGMKLDVARVVATTSTDSSCNVMPAQMTYEDSNGDLNILEYRVAGTGCRSQN
ncbi:MULTISPECIES: DUF2790 domain-containing protein [Pseudomonas]|uniref:DUF2790 domain-containing protein n=1 Tax=Pseudomonas marincola TaxID=437900 RepID=A0A653E118_9PSED|nr:MULTISPECIES: DUF2790 domain-containing protein [Pseudomonas]MBQ55659.1 DUF2790 domain-containing protein [Pseudomonadaceae bacterium]OEO25769.1 hypothetical protein AX279_10040 [Pseudomonas sp. J237]CAE6952653.1 conserved exported protein of unknown function [Pseudomonas marincola]HCP53691.1 DUF2790 domain-containing protein [Pseudomonas sp.]|tara:strand:- start:632 stop:964 length:333 start_codon:yes stop_codon:yes gene_type:complete